MAPAPSASTAAAAFLNSNVAEDGGEDLEPVVDLAGEDKTKAVICSMFTAAARPFFVQPVCGLCARKKDAAFFAAGSREGVQRYPPRQRSGGLRA